MEREKTIYIYNYGWHLEGRCIELGILSFRAFLF